ncbi:MAG: hypothetical protein KatS3mg028_0010 [Bacteroidia bacterium]|nr:MAG: hypothetical protein KatS3mg028_0010 [Bacteroidia bacterium]
MVRSVAPNRDEKLDAFKGLMYRHPLLSVSLMIALLSMAGIPVTAGFFAKYYVLSALMMSPYKWVVIAGLLASAVAVVYYLKIILVMFENDKKYATNIVLNSRESILLAICLILLIVTGIYPDIVANVFER